MVIYAGENCRQHVEILEEKHGEGVVFLLSEFAFHAADSCFEEKGYQVLVGTFSANHFQGIDIFRSVFQFDDKQGMGGS